MARIETNGVFEWIRGRVGDVVIKKYKYGEVMSRRPRMDHIIPSEKQLAQQVRWAQAAEYYRRVQADPALKACYAGMARKRGTSLPSLTNRDFFRPPRVLSIDLRCYDRRTGGRILIHAWDDTCVKAVEVTIRDEAGNQIEAGFASELDAKWEYRAQTTAPSNGPLTIEVTAIDLPGNRATRTAIWRSQPPVAPAPGPAETNVTTPSPSPPPAAQAEGGL